VQGFFRAILEEARAQGFLSEEHFTVDGTMIEAWAGHRSFTIKSVFGGSHRSHQETPVFEFGRFLVVREAVL
jgi:hypothetical protein